MHTSVRDLILETLADHDGLTLTQIHRQLTQSHRLRHTIQATKKALTALSNARILESRDKHYFFSMTWVLGQRAFLDRVLAGKARHRNVKLDLEKDHTVYSFDSLFELDNFWNFTLLSLSEKTSDKRFLAINPHEYFFIINIGFETSVWTQFKQKGFRLSIAADQTYPLNQWALKLYHALGFQTKAVPSSELFSKGDINVIGEHIIEVLYDPALFMRIRNVFKKYKRIEEIPPKTISEFAVQKGKIEFRITKNAWMADQIRARFKRYFKK